MAVNRFVLNGLSYHGKFVCADVNDIPDIAIVDPDMMSTMPESLTATDACVPVNPKATAAEDFKALFRKIT